MDVRKGGMHGGTEPQTQPVETTVHVLDSKIFQIEGGMSNFEELQYCSAFALGETKHHPIISPSIRQTF